MRNVEIAFDLAPILIEPGHEARARILKLLFTCFAHRPIVSKDAVVRNGVEPYNFVPGMRGTTADSIIERDLQKDALAGTLDAAAAGSGSAVVLSGPAGIGKTVLLDHALAAAEDLGFEIAVARPVSLERDLAFGVVRQLLGGKLEALSGSARDEVLCDGGELALPALGGTHFDRLDEVDPLGTVLHGLHRLCSNFAAKRPFLLVIDDAHWADWPSFRFLTYLARRIENEPLAVLAALRPTETDPPQKAVDELTKGPATVLPLTELSDEAVAVLVAREFPSADPSFIRACAAASGANPFYLGEILSAARQRGLTAGAEAAAEVENLSTEAVREEILRRIQRLGSEPQSFAEAAALFPAGARRRQVAAICGLAPGKAASASDALVRAGVLEEGELLEFRHPILRTTIHDSVSSAHRADMHRNAASLLISEHGRPQEIVFHLLNAEPAADPESARVLSEAARGALMAGAFDEAIAYANRALAEPPAPDDRAKVLRDIGVAEGHLGAPGAVERLRSAADAASTTRLRAEILRQLGWALLTAGRFTGVEQVLDEARESLGEGDRSLALEIDADLIAAAQMAMLPADLVPAKLDRWRATELAGRTRGERCLLSVRAFEAVRRNEGADLARDLALRANPPGGEQADLSTALPLYLGVLTLIYTDAYTDARRALDDSGERFASPRAVAVRGILEACLEVHAGDLTEAIATCQRVRAIDGSHALTTSPLATVWMAQALVLAGRADEAHACLTEVGLMGAPAEEVPFEQPLYVRALIHLDQDRPEEALADATACGAKLAERRSVSPAVLGWRSLAALACSALGREAEAQRWASEEVSLARTFGAAKTLGSALRVAGLVATPGDQLGLLEEASEVLEDSPAQLDRAFALIELGAARRRHGRRADSRGPLTAGLELAMMLGADGASERARSEILAAGGRPRREALRGVDALTEGERRVIRLAARGKTNREIGQDLVVTLKTVEMHLRNAYAKLDIASRRDLDDELRAALQDL